MNHEALNDDVRYALGRYRRLRVLAAVLWSSFMGAVLATMALYLVPEDWTLPPPTLSGAGWSFFVIWLLVLVPSTFASVLSLPRGNED